MKIGEEMLPLVEFCETNLSSYGRSVYEELEAMPNIEVLSYGCLSECTLCAQKAFCFFEGDRLAADTLDELRIKILEKLTEWEADFL